MESSLKRRLGYIIRYEDIEYEIVSKNYTLEVKMPSNGKLGQILHDYLQSYLIEGKVRKDGSFDPFSYNLDNAVKILSDLTSKSKFSYCDKRVERIYGVRVIGQADLCSDEIVIEVKSNSDLKKVDLIQALIYTFLYEKDVILFLYGIYSGDYTIIRVPFNQRNLNSLLEGIKKLTDK